MKGEPMITADNISKTFNAGRPNEFTAVREVSLTIDFHRVTILKGPSGSGKTTLLGMVGCMARPTSGRIFLGEREITSLTERFLTEIRRRTFGFIFQQFNLIKGISVLENVMIPAYPTSERYAVLRKRALDTLELFNLGHKAEARIEWLSGGEAQRVAIARSLINNPSIIIADEPTAHLDTKLSQEFMDIMRQLKEAGKTIILSSHDPIVYDSDLADCLIEMRDGRALTPGSAA
jgi:putative ABC transport system ATP-binding protein